MGSLQTTALPNRPPDTSTEPPVDLERLQQFCPHQISVSGLLAFLDSPKVLLARVVPALSKQPHSHPCWPPHPKTNPAHSLTLADHPIPRPDLSSRACQRSRPTATSVYPASLKSSHNASTEQPQAPTRVSACRINISGILKIYSQCNKRASSTIDTIRP